MIETELKGLPSGWAWTTFGEVTEPEVDQGGPNNEIEFTYIDIGGIDNRTKVIAQPKVLPVSRAPSRARQRLDPGDVLVSMTRPNLNAVALLPPTMVGAIGSTGFHVLRSNRVAPGWLFYLAQTDDFVNAMSLLVQGALYPAVRPKDIRRYRIPLAPLPEQRRIVAEIEKQFTRLDAAVAALKRMQANLKRYRASVLKAACEGRLVPTEAELARAEGRDYEPANRLLARILEERRVRWEADQLAKMQATGKMPNDGRWKARYEEPDAPNTTGLPQLPEGWAWARLDQLLLSLRNGIGIKPDAESGIPILRISAVRPGSVDLGDVRFLTGVPEDFAKYVLSPGDLLFTRYSGNPSLVGVCGVVPALPRKTVHPDKLIRGKVPAELCPPAFLEIVLNTGASRAHLARRVRTTAGQAGVAGGDLRSIPLPLPPLAEQHRIVAEVERRLSQVDELEAGVEANLKRAGRLRQAILKRAFEGKLVPQDPSDEPAGALLDRIGAERDRAMEQHGRRGGAAVKRRGTRHSAPTLPLFDAV